MMKVAFTFDDGPHPDTTQRLLKEMKERGVKATFFLLGEKIEQYPGLTKEIAENGHQIGNHSYSHLGYAPEKEEAFLEEIRRTNRIIEEFVGKPCAFCRPPYGSWDDAVAKKCELTPVFWDVETRDWEIKDKEQSFLVLLDMHKKQFKEDSSVGIYESKYNKLIMESSLSDFSQRGNS